MAHIETVAPHEASGDVQAMYARQQRFWGYVPNYAKVFCHRPEIMRYWAELQAAIRGHVEPRRFELVTFAAAHALGNTACTLAHGTALTAYLPDDAVKAIAAGAAVEQLPPADAAIVAFARKVALDAASITADDVASLRAVGLSDAEIFDIVAVAAARAFFAKLLDGLGVLADAPMRERAGALAEAFTVGRAVDDRPVERMDDAAAYLRGCSENDVEAALPIAE